tara:strand:- start:6835 stop:7200 length:366 start_codon:yes stop_codon:yes gene_type:complete
MVPSLLEGEAPRDYKSFTEKEFMAWPTINIQVSTNVIPLSSSCGCFYPERDIGCSSGKHWAMIVRNEDTNFKSAGYHEGFVEDNGPEQLPGVFYVENGRWLFRIGNQGPEMAPIEEQPLEE